MKIVKHWSEIPATPVVMEGARDAVKRLVVGPADGAPSFALRVFTLAPGGYTPSHRHSFEHENVILEGRGVLRTEDGDVPLAPGAVALVRPDEVHQFRNAGDTPFSFVCLVPNAYA
jgi:quercetin dioxygenase-like cupin family protein